MKAQQIIPLILATVAIPALVIACATKAQIALHARLQPSAHEFTEVDASKHRSAPLSQIASPSRSPQNPAVETTPIGTLTRPILLTNLVSPSSSFTNNTPTNPEPVAAIQRAESAPVPAATLGTRATSGEKSVVFWIGIFIAACLIFPAAAPLAGRILAAVVNRTPSLAGLTGIVSVEAFDALIKAIERSKQKNRLDNDSRGNSITAFDELDSNLARELNASHKRLVHARKQTLQRTLQLHDSP